MARLNSEVVVKSARRSSPRRDFVLGGLLGVCAIVQVACRAQIKDWTFACEADSECPAGFLCTEQHLCARGDAALANENAATMGAGSSAATGAPSGESGGNEAAGTNAAAGASGANAAPTRTDAGSSAGANAAASSAAGSRADAGSDAGAGVGGSMPPSAAKPPTAGVTAGPPPVCMPSCSTAGETRCNEGASERCDVDAFDCLGWQKAGACASGACFDAKRCATLIEGQWGGDAVDYAPYAMTIGPDGSTWVAGQTGYGEAERQGFVSKWSADGQLLWKRTIGTTASDWIHGVVALSDGSVVMVGETEGALRGSNAGSSDAFILKLPANANATTAPAFVTQVGSSDRDEFQSVALRADGKLVAAGKTWGNIASDAAATPDMQSLVVLFDPNTGAALWTRQWANDEGAELVAVAADGNDVYVLGHYRFNFPAEIRAFITRIDASGKVVWEKLLPASPGGGKDGSRGMALITRNAHAVAAYRLADEGRLIELDASMKQIYDQATTAWTYGMALGPDDSLLCTEPNSPTRRGMVQAQGFTQIGRYPKGGFGVAASSKPNELIAIHSTNVMPAGYAPLLWFLKPQP